MNGSTPTTQDSSGGPVRAEARSASPGGSYRQSPGGHGSTLQDTVEARVRTLVQIVAEYDDPDEKLTVLLGNFRRVVGERERFIAASKEVLRAFDMLESQVDIGSKSISEALRTARDGLRSVMEGLTS